ncbi:helix-turn-helix transcriptional regulator, partial [Phytoactinopolyspora endophytica]|uniref:helix-turn-helix transcriptional regulator n=1 Tax=Phytoactinopolyspora endophytica TaxID=1642495 RepID=UPI00197B50F8
EFEEWLTSALLMTQLHNYSELLDDTEHSPVPNYAVSIARELIENHPEWEHSVRSLAKAANVGVRTLQKGFAHHLGVAPKEYLTRVRMQRIHDELTASEQDMVTVSQVSAKWGLNHSGRFAADYRRRYGELPSDTLAR